ncbi:hypothetical protein Tcan_10812 [Toxocara canis]|uniref:Uncharacterized protein n=1 Tax=Toxocara canis TaxID=6265 RepID=A0A0B2UYJ6_TOXCA|nr:hypothetical protein Tcan_10812 [Toxocara canis]
MGSWRQWAVGQANDNFIISFVTTSERRHAWLSHCLWGLLLEDMGARPTGGEDAVPSEGQTWGEKKLWIEVTGTSGRAHDQAGVDEERVSLMVASTPFGRFHDDTPCGLPYQVENVYSEIDRRFSYKNLEPSQPAASPWP